MLSVNLLWHSVLVPGEVHMTIYKQINI